MNDRVYAEININKLRENIQSIRNYIGNTKFMSVIKADGYGHGAACMATHISDLVDFYGVATIDEALDLVLHFIHKPILILGAIFDEKIPDAMKYDIHFTVYDYKTAERLSEYAKVMNKTCKVHLKIETGMNRIGFKIDSDLVETIKKINNLPNIEIAGIFTHFANADEEELSKTRLQIEKFDSLINNLLSIGINIPIVHMANSAATLNLKESHRDMVRAGIISYGYYPSEFVKKEVYVSPALSLKTHVIFIKNVDKGEGVSYNSAYITEKPTKIATIPVGYGDGYPRSLSNKGYVLIKGKKARIIGRICMDQFMVDVSDFDDIKVNDEVVLIGRSQDKEITLNELADLSGKFIYEFICGLSKRIPRLYYKDNKLVDEVNYFYTSRRL